MSPFKLNSVAHAFRLIAGLTSAAGITAATHPDKSISEGEIYRDVELTEITYDKADSLPATLQLDPSNAMERPVDAILGFNWNWWRSDEIAFPGKASELNPDLAPLLAPLPMRLNRATGSYSQVFEWQASTGPREERPNQAADYFTPGPPKPMRLGLPEWIQLQREANPDFRISWVLNLVTQTPDDAANLAAYITLPADSDHPWAQQRVADGITDPVEPYVWELGNELDHNRYSDYTPESYADACREWIDAVSAVHPAAKFAVTIRGSPWNKRRNPTLEHWAAWHRHVLEAVGDDIDYLVFHPYFKDGSLHNMDYYMDLLEEDIRAVTGSDRIKLLLSEYGVWPAREDRIMPNGTTKSVLRMDETHNWASSLSTADFIFRLLQRPSVGGANYHSIRAGPWALIDIEDGQLYPTAIHEMFSLLHRHATQRVIPVQINEPDPGGTLPSLGAVAFATNEGLKLTVFNKHRHATFKVGLELDQPMILTEVETLHHPDPAARNTVDGKLVAPIVKTNADPSPVTSISIKPMTIAVYRFESRTRAEHK
ncbi:MAG: hypothetical protein SynsKO_32040 [Synoicihabitans sp.]